MAGLRDLLVVAGLPLVAVGLYFFKQWINNEYGRFMLGLRDLLVFAVFSLVAVGLYFLQQWISILLESFKQLPPREDVKQSSKADNIQYTVRFLIFGKRTDGVDIDACWCRIYIEKDKWTIGKVLEECIKLLSPKEDIIYRDAIFSLKDNMCFIKMTIVEEKSAGKTWRLLKKGIDNASNTDGVDIRWCIFRKPEISELNIEQVIQLLIQSKESEHLYTFMNAEGHSLPAVNIQQKSIKRYNEIQEIICDIHGKSNMAIVGSSADGLVIPLNSDTDVIMFAHTFKVFECIKEPFNMDYMHTQLIRVQDDTHPGYSKLRVISLDMRFFGDKVEKYTYVDSKDGILYLKNNVKELLHVSGTSSDEYTTHGPAHTFGIDPQTNHPVFTSGHSHTFERKSNLYVDVVLCIRSKQWPVEAYEWTTRHRASNWLTKELIDHIISTGYILAGVGSKESNEREIQWRVSFNEAEQLLIASFNETQIHCIFLLKYLKNYLFSIAGKNITSYTIKTVMFWCLDEIPDQYWQSTYLVHCFCLCVSKLDQFLESGFLPNYFIGKRNQFVAREFTCDIITETRNILEGLLQNPKAFIGLLLPSYSDASNMDIYKLHSYSQVRFIEKWLKTRIYTVYADPFGFGDDLLELYDGYNIQYITKRCNAALEKLTTVRYTQPLIKKLQNYMGVLLYLLLREETETGEYRTDSETRKQYSEYMQLSASADLTHTTLRIATCYLDDGVKEDCLNIILKVTESDGHLYMRKHDQCLNQTLNYDIDALNKSKKLTDEIDLYVNFIYDIDLVHQDPYRTTIEFEKLKEKGHIIYGYDTLTLAFKECYFDVTFMPAEMPVLPKPAALELCIDYSQTHVSFHPFLYGLLLEFLWHHKYGSGNEEKKSVLEKMENCILDLPDDHKSTGFNFLTYCNSLKHNYRLASKYLLMPFKEINGKDNKLVVTYLYIKYIINLLRMPSQGLRWPSKSCRQKNREHQIFVAIINISHFESLLNPLGYQGIVVYYCAK